MKTFDTLLLPLDGSPEAAKGVGCALWLAEALGATLHVLHAARQPLAAAEALARLHLPGGHARVILHQMPGQADAATLEAVSAHGVDLVIMSARGASASAGRNLEQRLGSIAQVVIERSPAPVLLLPLQYREVLPWTSMLAAASGETAADEALKAAVGLAAALRIPLTIMHADDAAQADNRRPLRTYADAAYHEYPHRMEALVKRGLSGRSADESGCIEQVLLRHGDPADILLAQVECQGCSVLALGWHGALGAGRALVLKRLLEEAGCALLLVRGVERQAVKLNVGE
ncbi:universal stress protein [Noviherbaspirillum galbum]|uniref:Universal stress protein n=1 Tax=Noviherbaspirillum galbum TaxID=2709383 RepID=A0A6B3ST61_9BURK|nr:universal stress protein [Noviherbaspirillum galbum]NEX63678.1 universal stress protein [Noviherbaspirillum galbum]